MTDSLDPLGRLPDPQNPDVRSLDAKTPKPAAATDQQSVQKNLVDNIFGKLAAKIPIVGDFVEALTGVEDGDYQDLGTFAGLLFGRDVSLASRVASLENKISVGAEFFDNFKRGDNDSVLGSSDPGTVAAWIQFGDGEPLGIHDQAAQMRRNALPDDGVRYARCPFLATSNDYVLAAVIHPKGTPNQPRTSFYGRCNADGTEGVYVDFFGNKTRIGRFTRSGNAVSRSQWLETAKAYSNSSTPQLRMIDTRYQVVIDDVVVIDYVDVSGFPVDSAHRTSMFSVQCFTAILQVPVWSAGLASFAVRNVDLSGVQKATQAASDAQTVANGAASAAQNAQTAAENAVDTAVVEATSAATSAAEAAAAAIGAAQQQQVNAVKSAIAGVQSGLPATSLDHSLTNHECSFDQLLREAPLVSTTATNSVDGVFIRPGYSGPRGSFIYATGTTPSTPAPLYIYIGRMDPDDGTVQIEHVSPDQTLAITGPGEQIYNFPTDIIFEPSELMWLAIHQPGSNTRRTLYGKGSSPVAREGSLFPATTRTRHISTSVLTTGTVLPQSTFSFAQTNIPWFGIGPSTILPLPPLTTYFENFESGVIPPTLSRQQGAAAVVIDGAIMLPGGLIDNGRRTYVVTQVMARDDHEVSGQVVSPTTRPQYLRVRSSVDLEVRSTGLTLSRGSDLKTIAMTVNSGDVFKLRAQGNVFTVLKLTGTDTWTVIPELTYTDSGNAIPRGRKYRYVSLGLNRSDFVNSGGWGYVLAQDLPDPA